MGRNAPLHAITVFRHGDPPGRVLPMTMAILSIARRQRN
jgi:hypothetical protein